MNLSKKIVPLQFSYWYGLHEIGEEYYQQLPRYMGLKINTARRQLICDRLKSKVCPCCSGELRLVYSVKFKDAVGLYRTYYACDDCGFFKFAQWDDVFAEKLLNLPFIKEFDARSEVPSLSQLSTVIHKNRDRLYNMDPTRFEVFVGSVLRDFYECEVYHVGRSGDDGIDLIVILGENPLMVQVKRRENSDATEGIEVVKLLFASAFGQGANSGMVVTTAQRFSRPARNWIDNSRLRDLKFKMQLVDVNNLMSMINAVRPKDAPLPWEVHKAQLGYAISAISDFQSARWRHIPLTDGDILLNLANKDILRYLVWRHDTLDSCYEIVASREDFQSIQPNLLSFDALLHQCSDQALSVLRLDGDQYFAHVASIPEKAMETIISRWSSKFPDVVINLLELEGL